ncbi:MAG: hypothetical protein Ta2B_13060 [Termitinemataceae bacterium]|nr:MAG: hypothetical protein Ta2B_13060 [Termitinemataceae bacterium]
MHQKCQKIKQAIDFTGVVRPVAEIVFQVVPVVFEHIIILVFDFPTGSGTVYQMFHVPVSDPFVCNPAVFVSHFVVLSVVNSVIDVVDQ